MKKEIKKPVGIYGGETNGANPLEWNLQNTILAQLRHLGWQCNSDCFGDRSASWIEVFKENPKDKKAGKILSFTIQFDFNGNVIQDIRFFEQEIISSLSSTKQIL